MSHLLRAVDISKVGRIAFCGGEATAKIFDGRFAYVCIRLPLAAISANPSCNRGQTAYIQSICKSTLENSTLCSICFQFVFYLLATCAKATAARWHWSSKSSQSAEPFSNFEAPSRPSSVHWHFHMTMRDQLSHRWIAPMGMFASEKAGAF